MSEGLEDKSIDDLNFIIEDATHLRDAKVQALKGVSRQRLNVEFGHEEPGSVDKLIEELAKRGKVLKFEKS